MAPQNRPTEDDVERFAVALHEARIGCDFQQVTDAMGMGLGERDFADHPRQARLLLDALTHAH